MIQSSIHHRGLVLATVTSILLAALATGCKEDKPQADQMAAEQPTDPRLVDLRFTDDELPRLDSSTSARPLVIVMASRLTGRVCLWPEFAAPMYGGHRFPMPFRPGVTAAEYRETRERDRVNYDEWRSQQKPVSPVTAAGELQNTDLGPFPEALTFGDRDFYNSIACHGTHGSYVQLIEDQADVIIVARAPSEDELKLAEDEGVKLDARPVAMDAFVFLRHTDNAVTGLTTEQIREIYRGGVTNWRDVGGPDEEIQAFTRGRNSGSQETMVSLVMNGEPTSEGLNTMMRRGMSGPYSALRETPAGIGYTFYYYDKYVRPTGSVETLVVDGIAPTSETIADRSYPFVTEVYVVTHRDLDPKSNAALLRDWLLTDEGLAVVAKSGYVPIR